MKDESNPTVTDRIVHQVKSHRLFGAAVAVALGIIGLGGLIASVGVIIGVVPKPKPSDVDISVGRAITRDNYIKFPVAVANQTNDEWRVTGVQVLHAAGDMHEVANDQIDTIVLPPHKSASFTVSSQLMRGDYNRLCGDTSNVYLAIDFVDNHLVERTSGFMWLGQFDTQGDSRNGRWTKLVTLLTTVGRAHVPSGRVSDRITWQDIVWSSDSASELNPTAYLYRLYDSLDGPNGRHCFRRFIAESTFGLPMAGHLPDLRTIPVQGIPKH